MQNIEDIKDTFIKKKSDSEETLSKKQIKKAKLKVVKEKLKEIEQIVSGADFKEENCQELVREFNKCIGLKAIIYSSDGND
jgi:hypothetical protein